MKRTSAIAVVLGGVCLLVACDEDKKPETTTGASSATGASASVAATPPPPPKPSPAELMAKTLKGAAEPWNAHDAAKVAANYAPNAKLVIPGLPEFKGRDAIQGEAKADFAGYSDWKVGVVRTFSKGSNAVIEWVVTGKNDGPTPFAAKATGRQIGVAGASVVTFGDDGLITEEHRYFDIPTLTSQLDPKAKAGTFRAPITLPTGAPEDIASKGTPDEAKLVDTAKAMYTAFEGKKEADLLAFATDDTAMEDYSGPTSVKGTKQFKDLANAYWKIIPDVAQTKPLQFAAGDWVITEGTMTGTQKGAMGPIKASNKPVSMRFVDLVQFKAGKIARFDTYADSAEMLVEIGAMPPITLPAPGAAPAASGAPAGSGSAMAAGSAAPPPGKAK